MGKSNTELLKIAQKHLGQGGSRFRKFCGLPSGAAYCNAFVCYVANEGGDKALYFDGKKMTYCPTSMAWCRKNLAQIPIYLALPMDIIYFDWEPNGVPNHIGFVRSRVSDQKINTIEGNTSGGIVAQKTRVAKYVCGVFRPHFKGTYKIGALEVDGYFGYNSIANLQKALKIEIDGILGRGTVKALQKRAGVKQDGSWGPATSKAVQKMVGTTVDGAFGPKSVKALQKWINAQNRVTPSAPKQTKADKLVAKAKAYSWPYGTDSDKWDYEHGAPTSTYKKACGSAKKITMSDCGYFIKRCVIDSGVRKSYTAFDWKHKEKAGFDLVHEGSKIPEGFLKAGDIVEYKKTDGDQHTLMHLGGERFAEAGRKVRFPVIRNDNEKYNKKNVKHSTIRVYRAK